MIEEKKDEIFQIPAEMIKAETKRNNTAVRLIFDSQENISDEALKRIFAWRNQVGWLLFALRNYVPDDLLQLPKIYPKENEKSSAQKMRYALYRLWQARPENFDNYKDHYKFYMERFRQQVLSWIPKDI
jgi:hypothetical protein